MYIGRIAVCGLVLSVMENIAYHTPYFILPWQDYNIEISYFNFPLHIITAISGSALAVYIGMKLSKIKFINTLGKGTLLVYLLNGAVQISVIHLIKPLYNSNIFYALLFHATSLLLCVLIMYILIKIIYGNKYTSWIVGKW